jgi:hypothetical protein
MDLDRSTRMYPAVADIVLLLSLERDGTGRCRGECRHGYQRSRKVLGVGIVVHGRELEMMHSVPGSGGVTSTGMDETVLSGVSEP